MRELAKQPDISHFYHGSQLLTFLTRTGESKGSGRVLGRHFIPGEKGKPGIHVRLKDSILDKPPTTITTRFPEVATYLEIEIDSGLGEQKTDLSAVVSFLDAADLLASATDGTEYGAIQVVNPPSDIVPWFEEQTTMRNSRWRKVGYDVRSPADLRTYVKWL